MIRFCLALVMLTGNLLHADPLKRLDPHGSSEMDLKTITDLKKRQECSACHTSSSKGLGLKPTAKTSCTNCHGSAPHSGTAEHMGRVHNGQLLTCLSCHSPHRASQVAGEKPLGFFSQPVTPAAPKGFSKSSNPNSMLSRKCTECHQW